MALTYPPHLRLQWGGVLGTPPVEIFSNTVRYMYGQVGRNPSEADLQACADAVAPILSGWFVNPKSIIGADAHLTYLKVTHILGTGKQSTQNTPEHEFFNISGANVATAPIWEQTYCLTLRTNNRRGRASKGRIFPPLSGPPPASGSPYCGDADSNGMAQTFANFLSQAAHAVQDTLEDGGAHGSFGVISPGNSTKGTVEMATYYAYVECDEVADIQHRRTNRVARKVGAGTAIAP